MCVFHIILINVKFVIVKKSKPKDKQLLRLKEVVDVQKVKFGITDKRTGKSNPTFSFFFDYRTRRLGYRFRVPVYDPERGRYIGKPVNKFFSYINDKNWKKYFKFIVNYIIFFKHILIL